MGDLRLFNFHSCRADEAELDRHAALPYRVKYRGSTC
jgi:hypothetical protein